MCAATWKLEIKVHADYTTEEIGTPSLDVTLVAASSGAEAGVVNTADCHNDPWELPYTVGSGAGSTRTGAVLSKEFQLPDGFGLPGALLVTKKPTNWLSSGSKIDRVYLATARVWPKGSEKDAIPFLTNSWVHNGLGGRIFFTGAPTLPCRTPEGLQELRQQELDNLRGPPGDTEERKVYERIYAYDVYNDLVSADAAVHPDVSNRAILGKAGGGTISYPRRLRTNGPHDRFGNEPNKGKQPWLPLDEMFFAAKQEEFDGGKLNTGGELAGALVELLLNNKTEVTRFEGFGALESLYTRTVPASRQDMRAGGAFKLDIINGLREKLSNFPEELRQTLLRALKAFHGPGNILSGLPDIVEELLEGLVSTWPLPLVRDQRYFTWHSDEEMGRQAVAGFNPFTIKLAPLDLFKGISKITAKDLHGLMGGLTLEEAVDQKRLFWQDYHTVIAKDIAPRVKVGCQYAGRGVFFKDPGTGALSIVAIELQAPGEAASDARVFTRLSDSLEVWQLAKAVYSSLDFLVHELVSHFAQTHAVMEPFAIATRRQLSAMHPVYQLMMPHYHYTMQINAAARAALINVDGIVEKIFTAGPLCMEFSARMYEESWSFVDQGLPVDLQSRGLAELDADKKVTQLFLEDFPYAEDGQLVWNALVDYFTGYLSLYYSDSGAGGRAKVMEDEELVAWWKEAREVGHADKAGDKGWISLIDIASLVQILATIAWIGSAHHAAVNFGQYAYAGYMPNKPAFVAKPIPARGSSEEEALLADFDFEYLRTLSDPLRTLETMLLTKLLSTHAQDESYLSGPQTDWISAPEAVALKDEFQRALAKAEEVMEGRNAQAASRARCAPAGIPYTLLYPSTDTCPVTPDNKGMTGRGIPYSVSI